ncbi:DUF2490 domain-containing protein [Flavihumibacter rivuli]|uniref:DUF2490 domain-containing protein n=1 Tax=Flavihumibacter rivuli TaxID=2838156 RepID=UPI001BDF3F92|nr:DUF2490 domain-containing protein [Flavihumibacter rivuli]ULQ55024.1 DUF2490 domain-containing protein [Flavihumibacter rivuli]
MRRIVLILLLSQAVAGTGLGQTTNSAWLASFNTFSINKKFSLHFDAQFRTGDDYSTMQTLLLRPGVNYRLNTRSIFSLGYAWISNRRTIDGVTGYIPENRIWEQYIFNHHAGVAHMVHRFRLEQRFINKPLVEGDELNYRGTDFAHRFRYFFRTILPFNGQKPFQKGFFGALQDEVFLNYGDNSAVNNKSFDQNRAYIALGYRLNPRYDLEAGYMNQYVAGRGNAFTNNHIIQMAFYTRLRQ